MKKKLLALVLAGLLAVSAAGCGKSPTGPYDMGYDSVYNARKDIIISLGMKRSAVEKLLGNGTVEDYGYGYEYPGGLTVEYTKEGKVERLEIDSVSWVVRGDIGVGDSVDDVYSVYGEKEIYTEDDLDDELLKGFEINILQYYPNKNGEDDLLNKVATVSFTMSNSQEKVKGITLYN